MKLPPSVNALFRNVPSIAPIPHRALLSLTGSQAPEFLNGVVAANIPTASDGHIYTAFIHAQGRVLYDVFIHSHVGPDGKRGYVIEYDSRPSEAPPLLSMLKRYILRSKVRVADVSHEYDVWSAWGSDKERRWETDRRWNTARSNVIEPVWDGEPEWPWGREPGRIRDRRAVGMGHRLLVRKGDRPSEASTYNMLSSDDYTLHRILHGVPEGTTDIPPMHAFPMESNLDIMGGLDFRKGCYVGQELTVRTYHTGTLRKRIFPVMIQSSDEPGTLAQATSGLQPGFDIKTTIARSADDNTPRVRPRGTGKLLTFMNGVGLALLRFEHIAAVEKGDSTFSIENGSDKWRVQHWRPEWFPPIAAE